MSALIQEQQFDWEGLVPTNEDVLEERIKFIQSNVGEVKTSCRGYARTTRRWVTGSESCVRIGASVIAITGIVVGVRKALHWS